MSTITVNSLAELQQYISKQTRLDRRLSFKQRFHITDSDEQELHRFVEGDIKLSQTLFGKRIIAGLERDKRDHDRYIEYCAGINGTGVDALAEWEWTLLYGEGRK